MQSIWIGGNYIPLSFDERRIRTIKDFKRYIIGYIFCNPYLLIQFPNLEMILSHKSQINVNDFGLYCGKMLNDTDLIVNIKNAYHHDMIIMFLTLPIKIIAGRYAVDGVIWKNDTILDIKQSIQNKFNINIKNQIMYMLNDKKMILENDKKLTDINIVTGMHGGDAIHFGLKITNNKIDNDSLIPIFVVISNGFNDNYYDNDDTKKQKITILNNIFPNIISLIIFKYIAIKRKTLFFVNENNKISTEIIPWDNAKFFIQTWGRSLFDSRKMELLDHNKTFKQQKLGKEETVYLHFDKEINLKIRIPYFYDNKPIILSVYKHQNIKFLKQQIVQYFNDDNDIKQMVKKYKNKFNQLISKLINNNELTINKQIKKKADDDNNNDTHNDDDKQKNKNNSKKKSLNEMINEEQIEEDFEIKLASYDLMKQYKYSSERIKVGDIINNEANMSCLFHGYRDDELLMKYRNNDTLFVIPHFKIKLILINNNENDDKYFVIDVNLNCLCLPLYSKISQILGIDVNQILLFVKDSNSDENKKNIIECNVYKSLEHYGLFTEKICIYYQIFDANDIKSCNDMKKANYNNYYYLEIECSATGGNRALLAVLSNWKISTLMEKIESKYGFSIDQQQLSHRRYGGHMDKDSTLSQNYIEPRSTIFLKVIPRSRINISKRLKAIMQK